MPHNPRKQFHRFLAARHRRLRQAPSGGAFWGRLFADPIALFDALWPPFLGLALYGGLAGFSVLSPLYKGASLAAFLVWLGWLFAALRGAVGFWPRWGHARWASALALLVGLSFCWGGFPVEGVKAWVVPPAYARLPSVSLTVKTTGRPLDVLVGSTVHVSETGTLLPAEATFDGQRETLEPTDAADATVSFTVAERETTAVLPLVLRRGWRRLGLWPLRVVPDQPPRVSLTEHPEVTARKTLRFAFSAADDYGVERIAVRVAPVVVQASDRREPVEVLLASPGVKEAKGAAYADLTALPWAGIEVTVQLVATDGAGRKGYSGLERLTLPSRSFHNPFARALIEERQKLLGAPDATMREEAANVMAGIARQQGFYRGDAVVLMALRSGAVRLVLNNDSATVPAICDLLWQTALRLEEGGIGLARANLAQAERDLSSALMRQAGEETLAPFLARMRQAMTAYFDALEAERARQPPALQQMDWPLATAKEMLTPEDLQSRLAGLEHLLENRAYPEAEAALDQLQALIENLRTTPPELTPDQYKIAQQTAALRALARGQKELLDETAGLVESGKPSAKNRERLRDGTARLLAQQLLLLSALRDAVARTEGAASLEIRDGEQAMQRAVDFLRQAQLALAQQKQAEALALIENGLLALSEKMRQALTSTAP